MQSTPETGKASLLYDPKIRGYVYQALLIGVVVFIGYEMVSNVRENLARQRIPFGLDFWDTPAGFDINQALIPYSAQSSYGQAFWVGLLNTLLVAAIGDRPWRRCSASSWASRGCRRTGSWRRPRWSMSR